MRLAVDSQLGSICIDDEDRIEVSVAAFIGVALTCVDFELVQGKCVCVGVCRDRFGKRQNKLTLNVRRNLWEGQC